MGPTALGVRTSAPMIVDWILAGGGPRPGDLFTKILPVLVGLVVVVGVGAVVIYVIRRALGRGPTPPAEGFTLQQLRELHAAGSLTDEQFERAKAAVIGRVSEGPGESKKDAPSAEGDATD